MAIPATILHFTAKLIKKKKAGLTGLQILLLVYTIKR